MVDVIMQGRELVMLNHQLAESGLRPKDFGIDFGDKWPTAARAWKKFVGKVERTRLPDEECMAAMGIEQDLGNLFEASGMSEFWRMLAYDERPETDDGLTLEFLCTLRITKLGGVPTRISFCMSKVEYECSTSELNACLGCPEDDDYTLYRKPSWYNPAEFWREITRSPEGNRVPYRSNCAKVTYIRNPTVRYLEKILSNTIFARTEGGSVINDELFCLWCLLNGERFNAGAYFILTLERLKTRPCKKIRIGGMVTIIANFMGIVARYDRTGEDLSIDHCERTDVLERRMGMICFKQCGGSLFPLPNISLTYVHQGPRSNWTLLGGPHQRVARALYSRLRREQGGIKAVNPDGPPTQAEEEDQAIVEAQAEVEERVEANPELEIEEEAPEEYDNDEWPPSRKTWRAIRRDIEEIRRQNNEMHGWLRGLYFDRFPNQQPPQDPNA